MQPAETLKHKPPMADRIKTEVGEIKETGWMEKIRVSIGDAFRDFNTASEMAREHLDGDKPLLRFARGATSFGMGWLFEKATDDAFQAAFRGEGLLLGRPPIKIGESAVRQLDNLVKNHPRIYYFLREGSQDVVIAALNNSLSFFTKSLVPSVEAKLLMWSLVADAGAAAVSNTNDTLQGAVEAALVANEKQNEELMRKVEKVQRKIPDKAVEKYMGALTGLVDRLEKEGERIRDFWSDQPLSTPSRKKDLRKQILGLVRGGLNLSNPVTLLGGEMMISSWVKFKENWDAVRKVRNEKGGLQGKTVYMPKDEHRGRYEDKRRWEDRKDKVYYGKSNWQQEPKKQELTPEEELLEKFG